MRSFSAVLALLLLPAFAAPAAPASAARAAPAAAAPAQDAGAAASSGKFMKLAEQGKELFATLHTSKGDITVRLFSKDAPKTVANFVGLATGEKTWTDPRTNQPVSGKPLYDGVPFHRVIPNFMIQTGDPLGNGTGTPGYEFEDEFQSGRTFDKPGILAMANRGPRTNGSQFFITVAPTPHLNNRHTIFGEVISGYDVAEAISKAPRGAMDKPNEAITIQHIDVMEKAPKASKKGSSKSKK